MPDFTFPTAGPWDNSSPPYRPFKGYTPSGHRYYVPLRLPNALLGFVRYSLSSPDTLYRPSFTFVSPAFCGTRRRAGHSPQRRDFATAGSPDTFLLHKETPGSPKFPSYPLEHMPWSQTPAVTRSLAITLSGLLPSEQSTSSAFTSSHPEAYPLSPQLYIFRGSIHSLHPRSIWLRTPVSGLALRLRY